MLRYFFEPRGWALRALLYGGGARRFWAPAAEVAARLASFWWIADRKFAAAANPVLGTAFRVPGL